MSGSTIGNIFKITTWGESHGAGVGVVIDGFPSGVMYDEAFVLREMERRAPGRNKQSTARKEPDRPEIQSGIYNGKTTGTPICAVIRNTNQRSNDYAELAAQPRPGHADYTGMLRYDSCNDPRGGGHFSGRLTAPLCIAGGICAQLLARRGITVAAHIRSIAQVEDRPFSPLGEARDTLLAVQQAPFPVLEEKAGERMRAEILRAREAGDSVGGVVECIVTGLPAGVGSPMFQGLESHLAAALFAIPAVKGVEFGSGFGAAGMRGSAHNDPFILEDGAIRTASNHAGGILGGISSGMPVVFRAAFKPTPSIAQKQHTVRLSAGTETDLQITGRHDPCIVPRAVPVVEAAAALVLLDALLDRNTDQIAWSAPQGARP